MASQQSEPAVSCCTCAATGPPSDQVAGPLFFPEQQEDLSCYYQPSKDSPIPCLVCAALFSGEEARDGFLQHLFTSHKIVVHRTANIASLKCYAEYWRRQLVGEEMKNVFPVIRTHPSTEDPSEDFFLLSESVPEDKEIRLFLQRKKLEALLEVQQKERTNNHFHRGCLFCPQSFTGNRSLVFQHMLKAHNFNIGQPDNIVFVEEYLDTLQQKIESLQCLYCERVFRDQATLRDHMRKKQHRKINPDNTSYDKFYIINYLEMGKSWKQILEEDDEVVGERQGQPEDWSDWEERSLPVACLFCRKKSNSREAFNQHMTVTHNFDFDNIVQTLRYDYHTQVKLVNYIRRKTHQLVCVHCELKLPSFSDLLDHLEQEDHCRLPANRSVWDQAQYLFPTYENDSLLTLLEDH